MAKKKPLLAWWIWSLGVLFLFYEFFLRVYPSAMVSDLMKGFRIGAHQFGTLSACFFYGYAPMQIIVGLLMDYFGARKLLTIASIFCGIGSFLFAMADTLGFAEFGRLFMGIGGSFAFVGMVYISSHWFPPEKRAFLVGLGNSIGMLGAFGAGGPLSLGIKIVGWKNVINILGVIGIILAIVFFLSLRIDSAKHEADKKGFMQHLFSNFLCHIKQVISQTKTWLNAIIALLIYMTTAAFASLWGIPFLQEGYQVSKEVAGFAVSMIFIGWMIGGPIIGFISDRCKKRKPFLYVGILVSLGSILPVIYSTSLPIFVVFFLLFLLGFSQGSQLLSFSLVVDFNPSEVKGTSIALTNFVVSSGTSLMQPFFGFLLGIGWSGAMRNGIPIYSIHQYKIAMLSFPATLICAFTFLFFLHEGKR